VTLIVGGLMRVCQKLSCILLAMSRPTIIYSTKPQRYVTLVDMQNENPIKSRMETFFWFRLNQVHWIMAAKTGEHDRVNMQI